jgi:hypothetical protein
MESKCKKSYETIKDYKKNIENVFAYIKSKNEILTSIYNKYLEELDEDNNYKLSLDTFNFQTKLINLEYDNYNKIFKIFINRMYGDYYKLYIKLIDYVQINVKNVKIVNDNEYPKYKDLEINVEYNIEIIDDVFSSILSILIQLSNYCLKKNHTIKKINKKQNNGININNFLNEKKYYIIILEQKINFFYEIINGYIKAQKKFFKRLFYKLKLIYSQLRHDINLETTVSNESNESDESDESIEINNLSSSNSSDSLFQENIENKLISKESNNKSNKSNNKSNKSNKSNNKSNKSNNKSNNKSKTEENEELSQQADKEISDEASEDQSSLDSEEYMKFF